MHFLPLSLQSNDCEDGPAVHATHAATIAHVIIQNCDEFCSQLKKTNKKNMTLQNKLTGVLRPNNTC